MLAVRNCRTPGLAYVSGGSHGRATPVSSWLAGKVWGGGSPVTPRLRDYLDGSFVLSRRERCLDKTKEPRRALKIGVRPRKEVFKSSGRVRLARRSRCGRGPVGPVSP